MRVTAPLSVAVAEATPVLLGIDLPVGGAVTRALRVAVTLGDDDTDAVTLWWPLRLMDDAIVTFPEGLGLLLPLVCWDVERENRGEREGSSDAELVPLVEARALPDDATLTLPVAEGEPEASAVADVFADADDVRIASGLTVPVPLNVASIEAEAVFEEAGVDEGDVGAERVAREELAVALVDVVAESDGEGVLERDRRGDVDASGDKLA